MAEPRPAPTMLDDETCNSPPQVPLAFRVGVIGHRPNRLPHDPEALAALQERLSQVLELVRQRATQFRSSPAAELYAPEPVQLTAVTSLAEGVDRMFARAALDLGYHLSCPLPFPREVFMADFAPDKALEPDSQARFDALLARAGPTATVFELDGVRTDSGAAYDFAAQVLMRQSDLVVAVWDGAPSAGRGGTAESVVEAVTRRVPVLWVSAKAPFAWRMLHDARELACLVRSKPCELPEPHANTAEDKAKLVAAIDAVMQADLGLAAAGKQKHTLEDPAHAREYLAERRHAYNRSFIWKFMRDLIGSWRVSLPKLRVTPYVAQIARAWPIDETAASPGVAWINRMLRVHYAWADKEADRYADAHRSSFVLSALFAAGAVAAALLPVTLLAGCEWAEGVCLVLELGFVGVILALMRWGNRRNWHQRWLEYRVLAEQIRELRLLTLLGGGRIASHTRAHLAIYGDAKRSWMAWHARAIARCIGLPNMAATPDYARACADDLVAISRGQREFHETTFERYDNIHERLHWIATRLFLATLLGVVAHLGLYLGARAGIHLDRSLPAWLAKQEPRATVIFDHQLVFIAAVFPAIGAACAAINNQGEFVRLAKRSAAMAANFAAVEDRLAALRAAADPPSLAELVPIATHVAESMVDEVSDWRIVVNDIALSGG